MPELHALQPFATCQASQNLLAHIRQLADSFNRTQDLLFLLVAGLLKSNTFKVAFRRQL
jgi:hypothetical protein